SRHNGSLADLPGFARRIVEGCSALLADGKHAWLSAWRTDAREGTAAALAGVLERFRLLLERAAGDRTVKPIALEAADGARTWCFLVAPDAVEVEVAVEPAVDVEIPPPEPEPAPHEPEPEPAPEP